MKRLQTILPLLLLCLGACGGGGGDGSALSPAAERGRKLASSQGCLSCHSVGTGGSVGPAWTGLAGRTVTLDDGSTVVADDAYLRESILQPSARTVKDYPKGLMETVIKPGSLSEEEVDDLIAYIKTLK